MSFTASTVSVSPYVAAAIIEHAKRRRNAAGFLLGTRTDRAIEVHDFIPMTHGATYNDVSSKAYADERKRRVENKRLFCKYNVIGWYSAGNGGDDLSEEDFMLWCEAPAFAFAGKEARFAVHVHCAIPGRNASEVAIVWSAKLTANTLTERDEKNSKPVVTCALVAPLRVEVRAPDTASNVALQHVVAKTLYDGGDVFTRSRLLNLDEVAFRASEQGKQPADALVEVQGTMDAAVLRARAMMFGRTGGVSYNSNKPAQKMREEVAATVTQITTMKNELEQHQLQNPSARDDFVTQRFKDALMIKAVTVLLRKELAQVEALASQYTDGLTQQQQQQPHQGR